MIQRTRVLYTGHVQGVGFRATTLDLANNRDVVGFVRNLSDGRVELEAEGDAEEIADLLKAIDRALGSHIRDRVRHDETIVAATMSRFHVRQ